MTDTPAPRPAAEPAVTVQWRDRRVLVYFGPEIPTVRVETLQYSVADAIDEAADPGRMRAALDGWAASNDLRLVSFADQPDHCDPLAETISVGFRAGANRVPPRIGSIGG